MVPLSITDAPSEVDLSAATEFAVAVSNTGSALASTKVVAGWASAEDLIAPNSTQTFTLPTPNIPEGTSIDQQIEAVSVDGVEDSVTIRFTRPSPEPSVELSGCSTTGGTIRGGDDIETTFNAEVNDDSVEQFSVTQIIDGQRFDTGAWTPSSTVTVATRYDFRVWRQFDWSGVAPNGTLTAPVELQIETLFVDGTDRSTDTMRLNCGSVALFNEAQDTVLLSIPSVDFPPSVRPAETFDWSVTVANSGVESETVTVEFQTLNEPSGQASGTVPAGGRATFSGSGQFNSGDLPAGEQIAASVSVEGSSDSTSSRVGTIGIAGRSGGGGPSDLILDGCNVSENPQQVDAEFEASVTVNNPTTDPISATIKWVTGGVVVASVSDTFTPGSTAVFAGFGAADLPAEDNEIGVRVQ